MIETFENIVKFILTHRFVRIALNYVIISFLVSYITIAVLIFYKTNFFYYNPLIIFYKETYLWLWENYTHFILAFLLAEQVMIWLYFFYSALTKNAKKNLAPKPKEIIKEPLEEVMKLWLDDEEIREFHANRNKPKKESVIEPKIDPDIQKAWVNATQLAFIDEIKTFLYETIMPNINSLTTKELQLIIKILTILQDNKHCPSVTSIYSGDSNKTAYGNHLLADYTQFKALAEFVPLLKHSLSVAKNTLVVLNESKIPTLKKNKMIGQCLICGLAHDLGKIQRFETLSQVNHLTDKEKFSKMQREKPHNQISETFLKNIAILEINMDLDYAEIIAETVLRHHNPPDEKDQLLEILIQADIKTRNEEKEYCCLKIKEKLTLQENNKALVEKLNTPKIKESKKETKTISTKKENSIDDNVINNQNDDSLFISDFSQREIDKNYGLGEFNGYLASISTQINAPIQETISKHFKEELEKNLSELNVFIDNDTTLLFFKSTTIARAENTLRKLALNEPLKHAYVGYISLKNETNIQEAVKKAKEAMNYSKTNNSSVTNYNNIVISNQSTKKIITDDDLSNEFLSGKAFENISQEITQIEKKMELTKEMPFEADIESIKSKIIKNIAKLDDAGNFLVLPYKRRNRILVEVNFLKKIIATLTNCNNEEAQKKMNYLVKTFGDLHSNPRLIYEVSTRKGHYNALYNIILQDNKIIKYPCIPFCAKALKISTAELSMYSNQETLNGIKIELFANKD